jgi:hypothetical protein
LAYVEKMRLQIAVWDAEIEKLRVRRRTIHYCDREILDVAIRDLVDLRAYASANLREAEQVPDIFWDDCEERFETAWHRLSGAVRSVRSRLGR